jgi:hypothetical protein
MDSDQLVVDCEAGFAAVSLGLGVATTGGLAAAAVTGVVTDLVTGITGAGFFTAVCGAGVWATALDDAATFTVSAIGFDAEAFGVEGCGACNVVRFSGAAGTLAAALTGAFALVTDTVDLTDVVDLAGEAAAFFGATVTFDLAFTWFLAGAFAITRVFDALVVVLDFVFDLVIARLQV